MDIRVELHYIKMLKKVFSFYVQELGYDEALHRMEQEVFRPEWDKYGQEVMQWYDLDGAGGAK